MFWRRTSVLREERDRIEGAVSEDRAGEEIAPEAAGLLQLDPGVVANRVGVAEGFAHGRLVE